MLPEKLKKFTVQENGCWIWYGSVDKNGYGRIWYKGRRYQAYRLIYMIVHDIALASNIHVHHNKCRNTRCVNHEHMLPLHITKHNILHHTKIVGETASTIVRLYQEENMPVYKIENKVGVNHETIAKYLESIGLKKRRRQVRLSPVKVST